ncbi:hypothetical protein ABPG72_021228 [Tetrahymena utriculariae]
MNGGASDGIAKVKILTLGESGVGKSSLLLRYKDDKFAGNFVTTLGVEYKQKQIQIENIPLTVQVWDTAGQERFKTITPNYYRSVDGALLVFDISELETFDKIEYWIQDLQKDADLTKVIMVLVGNKSDLDEKRKVDFQTAQKKAQEYQIEYIETSAKTNSNVDQVFEMIVRKVIDKKGGFEKFKAQYQEQMAQNLNLKKANTSNGASGSNKNKQNNNNGVCC